MDVPALVRERLEGESVRTRVPLGDDDAVFVTPSRTLVYRAEGLLSDESVAAYPHDVERLDLKEGRRKATFELTYVDGAGTFTVPLDRAGEVLGPLLGGVLRAAGALEEEETVRATHRFSELTLIVADGRLLKHVGSALWDQDFEAYPFADVTDLGAEEGNVATGIVIEVGGRPERVKVPSEDAGVVRRELEEAILSYHGVDSVAELRETRADEPAGDDDPGTETFEDENISPLVDDDAAAATGPEAASTAESDAATVDEDETIAEESGFVPASEVERIREATRKEQAGEADVEVVLDRLDRLEATLERQTELVEKQQETIEQLVEELRRGR